MKEIKETIKSLGEKIRGSNTNHQALLRERLSESMEGKVVRSRKPVWKPMIYTFSSIMAVIVLAIALSPNQSSQRFVSNSTRVELEDAIAQDMDFSTGVSVSESMPSMAPPIEVGETTLLYRDREDDGDIVDFKNTFGEMLEQNLTFSLLTKDHDADVKVRALFSSLGGHVSDIYSYSSDSASITGVIPVQSIDLFKTQLDEFVKNDAFILESLNAYDLIPQAIQVDETIQGYQESIEGLKDQLVDASSREKEDINEQITFFESLLEQSQEQRETLDDRVDYVDVSVTIETLPNLWKATDHYDIEMIIAGYDEPGFGQRVIINILYIFVLMLIVFSVTFWLVIPIGIWIWKRRSVKKKLQALE